MFRKFSIFIAEVKSELRKTNWPWDEAKSKSVSKYKELVDSTIVVLIAMILLGGFVAASDFVNKEVVAFISGLLIGK